MRHGIRRVRVFILALLLCAWSSGTLAGLQHYQAPLHQVEWKTSSKKLHCALSHDIPLYGRATFSQDAGENLVFRMEVKQAATRNRDKARLRSMPPEWKHQIQAVDLAIGGTSIPLKHIQIAVSVHVAKAN